MLRRIRWQIIVAVCTALIVFGILGGFAISSAATTQRLTGKVHVEGVVGDARQLNPLAQGPDASPAERDIAALLFEALTQIGTDGRVEPALAEEWTVSADSQVYTFTLAADRTWHDGAPVTADDVLYTVRGVQNASFPGDPSLATLWRNVLVDAPDAQTVRFELTSPYAPFPSLVARLPILPAHKLRTIRPEQWVTAPFSKLPVGTGPWQLAALEAKQALLVPFTAHPGAPLPLDHLLLRFFPTTDAALLALSRREVHSVAAVVTPGRRLPVPSRHTQRIALPLDDYAVLTFNLQEPPFDDAQFRQVFALGLNRDLLVTNVLGGQGRRIDTPILLGSWAADAQAQLPSFRRSAAQQLLGRLGFIDSDGDGWRDQGGERLTLPLLVADNAEGVAVGNEIARQFREIGVELQVRRTPIDEFQTALVTHNFTLAVHSWSHVGADPDVYALWHSSQAEGGANYAALRDDQIDQLLLDGRTTTAQAQRQRMYGQFQRRWVELIPSLPLYQSVLVYDVDAAVELPAEQPALLPSRTSRFSVLLQGQLPTR